jgi:hypothetical protein
MVPKGRSETTMADTRTPYDEDFVAWTEQQTEALRAAARGSTNQPLDWENLAEEIEDLGRSVRRELRSQLTRIIHHLLKFQHSPAIGPRRGWKSSMREARSDVAELLSENRSLRDELARLASEQLSQGMRLAAWGLEDYGELEPPIRAHLQSTVFTSEQILDDWFPPEPTRASGADEEHRQ